MPCKILEPSKSLVYLDFCIVYLPRYYLLAAVQLKSRWDRRYDKDNLVHKSLVGLRLKHMPRETNYTLSWTKRKRINYIIEKQSNSSSRTNIAKKNNSHFILFWIRQQRFGDRRNNCPTAHTPYKTFGLDFLTCVNQFCYHELQLMLLFILILITIVCIDIFIVTSLFDWFPYERYEFWFE